MHPGCFGLKELVTHSNMLMDVSCCGAELVHSCYKIVFYSLGVTEGFGYLYEVCFQQTKMIYKFQLTSSRQGQLKPR